MILLESTGWSSEVQTELGVLHFIWQPTLYHSGPTYPFHPLAIINSFTPV